GPSEYLQFSIWHAQQKFQTQWPTSAQLYMPHGRLPEVGEIVRNPDLAHTFERLLEAEHAVASPGRAAGLQAAHAAFYRGEIAQQIVAFAQSQGGLLALEDL